MDDTTWRQSSMRGALWGMFIGDALAMPAHWFYNTHNIDEQYPELSNPEEPLYVAPRSVHCESMMSGMDYQGEIDVLHQNRELYNRKCTDCSKLTSDEHGNQLPGGIMSYMCMLLSVTILADGPEERVHYHRGLAAGENTLEPKLCRILMQSMTECQHYAPKHFLKQMTEAMTSPPAMDTYLEVWARRWFENLSLGKSPFRCAASQKNIWSIGSMGGWVLALPVMLYNTSRKLDKRQTEEESSATMRAHVNLTHDSENVVAAVQTSAALLEQAMAHHMQGEELVALLDSFVDNIRPPKITGQALTETYRRHHGPGNVPSEEMYRIHTELEDKPYDFSKMAELEDREVVGSIFSSACYTEHGLAAVSFFLRKYAPTEGFMQALRSNALCGGDSTHRGAILGFLLGALLGDDAIPKAAKEGLADYSGIQRDIESFIKTTGTELKTLSRQRRSSEQ